MFIKPQRDKQHAVQRKTYSWWRCGPSGARKTPHPPVLTLWGRDQSVAPGSAHLQAHTWPQSVFSPRGECEPTYFPPLTLLLLLSGDIETNPGPYMCPTCNLPWKRHHGAIQCEGCSSWTHYNKRCSGVHQHRHIPQGWRCKTCLLYTSPSPRDKRQSRMPSSA